MLSGINSLFGSFLSLWDRRRAARLERTTAGHVQSTVDRFKYLVEAHGMTLAQFCGMLPKEWSVRLAQFKDDVAILELLTPTFLEWTAGFFGVQRKWLDGGIEEIYPFARPAYKYVDRFIPWLKEAGWWTSDLQMLVFTSESDLQNASLGSPMAIVLARPFPALPESELLQFLPTSDGWDWGHPPCQHSILHLAAQVVDLSGISVCVHRVPRATVKRIQLCKVVPNPMTLKRCRQMGPSLDMLYDLGALLREDAATAE